MPDTTFSHPVLAAALDPQYQLPPFRQNYYTPSILISVVLLATALVVVICLSRRARAKGRLEARREELKGIEKVILKRGGTPDDVDRMFAVLNAHPECDPASMVMLKDRFHDELRPFLEAAFDRACGERMENLFFPPFKDTRRIMKTASADAPDGLPGDRRKNAAGVVAQMSAGLSDLMDSALAPGTVARLAFDGLDGVHECMVMGHDSKVINVTLPAHRDKFVAAIQPGMSIEGTLEHGPSLIGFSSSVIQAIAGSMPYCRIAPWKAAWEIRKRNSIRLPAILDIDFQHIATASADSINMSNLEKEIGALRPGRLIDISHGGCCIETPSAVAFSNGDMIRFSRKLAPGDPPATFLGAVVKVDDIDPEANDGSRQRLHVQFLIIDDVSQRILVRALRQLQSAKDREDWMQSQQLLQQIRRHNIENIGSPAPAGGAPKGTAGAPANASQSTRTKLKPPTRAVPRPAAKGSSKQPEDAAPHPPAR